MTPASLWVVERPIVADGPNATGGPAMARVWVATEERARELAAKHDGSVREVPWSECPERARENHLRAIKPDAAVR